MFIFSFSSYTGMQNNHGLGVVVYTLDWLLSGEFMMICSN
jgi:hypothetical protein